MEKNKTSFQAKTDLFMLSYLTICFITLINYSSDINIKDDNLYTTSEFDLNDK